MKTFKQQAAQGDLLIKRVSELPKGLKEIESKVVALGEATGHHHFVHGNVRLYDGGIFSGPQGQPIQVKYAHVLAEAFLTHGPVPEMTPSDDDYHTPIQFPEPGIYEIRQQVERSMLGWRTVVD